MSNEVNELVKVINNLSDDAFYMVSRDWFGMKMFGQTILAKCINERQEKIFSELLKLGFVYLDTERGEVGYRSSDRGIFANQIIKSRKQASQHEGT